jgi:hypothetical protein
MAIWIGPNLDADSASLPNLLNRYKQSLGKLLLCLIHDAPQSAAREVENQFAKNQSAVDQLLASAKKLQIDARVISLIGLVTPAHNSGSLLDSFLSRHQLPPASTKSLTPLSAEAAAKNFISAWFDRQYKGKWIAIMGEKQSSQQIAAALPQLPSSADDSAWDDGSTFNPANLITITEPNLDFLYQEDKAAPPPIVSNPPVTPPQETNSPFKAVVVPSVPEPPPPPPPVKMAHQEAPPPKITPEPARVVAQKKVSAPIKAVLKPRSFIPPQVALWGKRGLLIVGVGLVLTLLVNLLPPLIPIARAYQLKTTSSAQEIANTRQALSSLPTWPSWAHQVPGIKQGMDFIENAHQKALVHVLTLATASHLDQVINSSLTAGPADPYAPLLETRLSLDQAYQWAAKLEASSADLNQLSHARTLISLLPQLFPQNTRVDVLLLLQNNLELRPTGGFIGSVTILTIDNGKMINLETKDIYELDNNLKGVVTPPQEVAQYLGESSWYFRDANWNPSFAQSASTANWFLEKEWGRRAHLVIGINLNGIKSLLSVLGPITVATGQTINADNLLISALNHQDIASAKPEDQKQEFISLLIKPLIDALVTANPDTKYQALLALGQSLHAQETTLMGEGPIQATLHNLGWAGDLVEPECPNDVGSPCQTDSIFVNEANVGINKANYYLSREITHTASIDTTTITHQHQIVYQNQSPAEVWPAGPYKTYARLYLPKSAAKPTVSLDGAPIDTTALNVSATASHQVIGLYYEIAPQQTRTLVVNFSTQRQPDVRGYQLHFFKQPGQLTGPLTITINSTTPVSRNGQLSNQHQQATTFDLPTSFSVKLLP